MTTEHTISKAIEEMTKWTNFYYAFFSPCLCMGGLFVLNPTFFMEADIWKLIAASYGISFLITAFVSPLSFTIYSDFSIWVGLNNDVFKNQGLNAMAIIMMLINSFAIAIALALNWLGLPDKTDTLLGFLPGIGKYGTWAIVILGVGVFSALSLIRIYRKGTLLKR